MRIARIRHLFYPDMPRDYFYELSARQAGCGHQVDVLTWCKSGGHSEKSAEGFVIHRLSGVNLSLNGLVEDYPYLPGLASRIEMLKPNIVHGESHLFLPTLQAVKKAKKLGLPCVVTVHGVFGDRGAVINLVQEFYLRTLGLQVFRDADKVICLTRGDSTDVVKFGCPAEKITLIPNAVDTDLFKPRAKQRDDLVIWVGRYVPEKGLEFLVEAARLVVNEFADAKFLLVGYGPLKAKIMKAANDKGLLGRSVHFGRVMSRDEIAELLSGASIFAFPSLKEGLPISVLEAMASGLPVVGSDISGVRDLIVDQQTGVLVPPKTPRAFAKAILALLNDKSLRKRMGEKARCQVVTRYSWGEVIRKIEAVYDEAMNRFGSCRRNC